MTLSSGREVQALGALALASAGDSARAQTIADDLAKHYPEDTLVQFSYLPTIHARLTLNHNDTTKAVEFLEGAAPYELGVGTWSSFVPIAMLSVFLRGETYIAAHKGTEAATEFQKILDHRGIVVNEPIGGLAHLQLGRGLCDARRHCQSEACLSVLPHALERGRPRHPYPESSQSRVCAAAVAEFRLPSAR
jgi:eukaryotic-like serine/threonine-protein kinase